MCRCATGETKIESNSGHEGEVVKLVGQDSALAVLEDEDVDVGDSHPASLTVG